MPEIQCMFIVAPIAIIREDYIPSLMAFRPMASFVSFFPFLYPERLPISVLISFLAKDDKLSANIL